MSTVVDLFVFRGCQAWQALQAHRWGAMRSVVQHPLAVAELPPVTMPGGSTDDRHHTMLASQLVVVDVEIVCAIGYVELHDGVIYSTGFSSPNRIPTSRVP